MSLTDTDVVVIVESLAKMRAEYDRLKAERDQLDARLQRIASYITPMRERFRARKGTPDQIKLCIADVVALMNIEDLATGKETPDHA